MEHFVGTDVMVDKMVADMTIIVGFIMDTDWMQQLQYDDKVLKMMLISIPPLSYYGIIFSFFLFGKVGIRILCPARGTGST